ncbi:MAG TPA: carboxypeptidase-like regulatory domain-containing protein [Terriglobales bacterium]|nr:carboxypeptidase-like regulatory domain-containing protein [Terriglobales bacterium]
MKRTSVVALLLLLIGLVAAAEPYRDKKDNSAGRLLTGKVYNRHDNPLPGSVVYLTNTRTHTIKTYIVGQDGAYRFPALSPDIDYEVYAQLNGRRSDTKTASQFDNRSVINIDLRIDTK